MTITLTPSPEQDELRATARRILSKSLASWPNGVVEGVDAFDEDLWRQLAESLGATGILVPASLGGFGGTLPDLTGVLLECGAAATRTPLVATVLAAEGIIASGNDDAAQARLPELAAGALIGTVALPESHGPFLRAENSDAGWTVSGTTQQVLFGARADLLVVWARGSDGPAVFMVDGTSAGVTRTPLPPIDLSRNIARLDLESASATLLCSGAAAEAAARSVFELAAFCLAAESTGGAQRCLDITVEYAGVREQFGRLIGAFQAIRHRLADVFTEVEAAKSVIAYAAALHAAGDPDFSIAASIAKSHCVEAFHRAANDAIQIHGGVGFTWEHEVHWHFKRAHSANMLFGTATQHRDRIADLLDF